MGVLRKHSSVHKETESFTCYVCGKNFKRPDSLRNHLRDHDNDITYDCSACQRSYLFKHTQQLQAHIDFHINSGHLHPRHSVGSIGPNIRPPVETIVRPTSQPIVPTSYERAVNNLTGSTIGQNTNNMEHVADESAEHIVGLSFM